MRACPAILTASREWIQGSIEPGDILLNIDGKDVSARSGGEGLSSISLAMMGPLGSCVELELRRTGDDGTRRLIELVRGPSDE